MRGALPRPPESLTRRGFVAGSAGTLALGIYGGAMANQEVMEQEVPGEPGRPDGALYTYSEGYDEEDIRGWRGRRVFGVTIGIIQLESQIPMAPGNMGNASTFPFPVLHEGIGRVDPNWVVSTEPHPEVLRRAIAAAKRLEMQGVRAIIGNCGFFANYQPQVASEISTPFFSSSLMQIPLALASIGSGRKVGVLTANGPALEGAPALEYAGVTDRSRIVIYGAEEGEEMKKILAESDEYNLEGHKEELVALSRKMIDEHPEVGAVVLECSEFPPHAYAIQNSIRLNVWGFTTLAHWAHSGALRRPFSGWM